MTQPRISRTLRRVSLGLFAAAVGAVGLGLFGPAPQLARRAQAAASAVGHAPKGGKDYDLSQLEIFRKVVVYIKDNYVDPKRIDPREMFVASLEAIEKSATEVMVDGNARDGRVKVTCGAQTREFDFKDVESIWMIPHRIKPIFAFLQENLAGGENRREVEYAAINGMLSTLDPHSWLLKPELYREMKLQTKGEFGGLGFVITMDEERLTVRKVLKNTPASRAGIRKGDHIARIEDESTINMDLNEAVSKLRGKPGTEVRLFVKRAKEEDKLHRLVRDLISVESVTSQPLAGGVGYVRLSSFTGTTWRDLQAAIRELKKKNGDKLAGLVLDMRSNPGGLLEQAILVSDQFIDEGTLVTTSGMNEKLREPKAAHKEDGDREFPVAVLVNSESASASEIVAGALKNLDRAVIIGRQTFGKGSVQVLYDLLEPGTKEESALKLTIAQYLTPGDKSIQEIGVSPDIELLPARLTKERVDLFAPPKMVREADLDKHFGNGFGPQMDAKKVVESAERPVETLRYLREDKVSARDTKEGEKSDPNAEEDEAAEEPDEENVAADYQVEFARELLLRAPKTDRSGMLAAARPFLAERRAEEEAKIQKSVEALGVDWSVSKKAPTGLIAASTEFKVDPPRPQAGTFANLTLTVTNTGKAPLERLRAYTRCDAEKASYQGFCSVLDRREFLLGRVAPGERRTWTSQVKIPNHMPAAHEVLSLVFEEAHGNVPETRRIEVDSADLPRPAFAFTYQVMDADGLAQPGETVEVQVDVKNVGLGKSSKGTYVSLRNPANDKVFMKRGRIGVGELKPGETRTATLVLEVRPGVDVTGGGIPLKLEIGDRDLWEFTTGKVLLPSLAAAPAAKDESGKITLDREAIVRAAPTEKAPPVAEAKKGAQLPVLARYGDFVKVDLGRNRSGFLNAAAGVVEAGKAPSLKAGETRAPPVMFREPPAITLAGIDTSKGAVVVDGDKLKLSGSAADPAGLIDVRVFVDNEKVLFRSARMEAGGEAARAPKLGFGAELPLKVGNNMVLVVAREDEEFSSQRTLIVHRRAPALAERK
jgi:carboxyl-terminal processing protease